MRSCWAPHIQPLSATASMPPRLTSPPPPGGKHPTIPGKCMAKKQHSGVKIQETPHSTYRSTVPEDGGLGGLSDPGDDWQHIDSRLPENL